MLTILVINSKGDSGKTTLTTNLAAYYASKKIRTAIMDYDPQGSSIQWLRVRPGDAEKNHGANAAPAGAKGLLLQELLRRLNYIVIPVAVSPIDIHATADFIKELFLFGGARTSKAKIAVVANRLHSTAPERFPAWLKLPFLKSIRDSDNYFHAAEKGLGVFEMDEEITAAERREFLPILRWPNGQFPNRFGSRIEDKTGSLEGSRRFAALRTGTQHIDFLSATGSFRKLS